MSGSDFFRYYNLLQKLYAEKLSNKHVEVNVLLECITLHNNLDTVDPCWPESEKIQRLVSQYVFPNRCSFKVCIMIEEHVEMICIDFRKRQLEYRSFIFLCCIKDLYKDLRKMLYDYVNRANQQNLLERIDELKKFKSRHFSRKKDNLKILHNQLLKYDL